jgi:chlorobactene glucosyltransferase
MLKILLAASVLAEIVLYGWPWLWRQRRYAVALPLVLTVIATVGLLVQQPGVVSGVVLLFSVFRVLNHLRIAKGRMHEAYLLQVAQRTSTILGPGQIVLLNGYSIALPSASQFIVSLAVVQAVVAIGLLLLTMRNMIKTKHRPQLEHYADRDLPTVTVAIPARNETADLEACLHTILANDYPKLEVLVLDDCSQDQTSEVIKSFAQDGVRFVKGAEPEERWLAKNQAYDKLADEANGEFVLFCGVDVRFGSQTIRALVTTALTRQKDMVSVMPRRLTSDISGSIIQSMRYWWELVPPRRYFNRPPVLSTCWLIRRKKLKALGSMEAVRHAIIPEGYFARELIKTDGYSFIRADDTLDVQTGKRLRDQYDTAIRTRYPQLRRRPEMALLLTLVQFLFLIGPFVLLGASLWTDLGVARPLAALASGCLVLIHVMIVRASNPANVALALFDLPFALMTEVVLGYISMFKYEFSTVTWKDRNICIPVMHVIPSLPKPDETTSSSG